MNKTTVAGIITVGLMVSAFSSCSRLMNEHKEGRVPEPPPGTTSRTKPWNETQRFEGEAALGPLATPRR